MFIFVNIGKNTRSKFEIYAIKGGLYENKS